MIEGWGNKKFPHWEEPFTALTPLSGSEECLEIGGDGGVKTNFPVRQYGTELVHNQVSDEREIVTRAQSGKPGSENGRLAERPFCWWWEGGLMSVGTAPYPSRAS